ncbi:MAG: hydroxymethylbilane synthase, partial [Pseudobdellovibrionaceae bacterium]
MRVKIASRKSDLARIQAYQVGETLKEQNPQLEVEYFFRESLGDQNLQDPLWKMPEKGVFTEDFLRGLIEGEFDLVVHSWKDLPTAHREHTEIVGTLTRADSRDMILFKKDSIAHFYKNSQNKLRLFSSSPRREQNLIPFLKEFMPFAVESVEFSSVRGNVQTRIQKMLDHSEVDGLVVAKAAMDRLLTAEREEFLPTQKRIREMVGKCNFIVPPLSLCPTAAAQGALAIEIKRDRTDLKGLVKSINCSTSYLSADLERRWLSRFGGGCHLKIGVSAKA